jgi:hypothetical protein
MKKIKLREIAFSRSGDKGDISNISVIPYNEKDYELIKNQLTVERVKEAYGSLIKGDIERYDLPGVKCLNFVMYQALEGGVSRSLCLDIHGKARCSIMASIVVEVPDSSL